MTQDQTVNISFGSGVDTKTNEKLVLPTKLLELENGYFVEKNTIRKRPGYDSLSKNIFGGGTISSAQALFNYNDELLLYSAPSLYSYNENLDSWVLKGSAYSYNLKSSQVIRNGYQQSQVDHAFLNNIYIVAWKDTRGGIRYTVKDFTTKLDIATDQQVTATGVNPRLVACGEYIFLYYSETSNLYVRSWSATSTTWSSASLLGADLDSTNNFYDVEVSSENMVIAYRNTTPAISLKYVKQDRAVGSVLNGLVAPITIANTISTSVNVVVNQSTRQIAIFWHNSVSGMQYTVVNPDFTIKRVTTVFDATLTATVSKKITAYETTAGNYTIFYEADTAATYNRIIKKQTATDGGSVGTASVFKRGLGLASKVFSVNSGYYFLTVHDSTLQATYFLASVSGDITNKFSYGTAGGLVENNMLNNAIVSGTTAYLATQVKTKLISDNGTNYTLKGVQLSEIDFNASNNFYREKLGEDLHITGGFLSIYDGQSVVEHGFHVYPENITSTPATSGGSMADGTYLYYVTYEWIDAKGQIHRSSPSVAVSAVVSGGGGAGKVTLTIPTLRFTAKESSRVNVNIGVYRTKVNATIAYRVSSISSYTFNDTTVDSVSFVDTLNDTSIAANDLLYTTGNVLRNGQSQSASLAKNFKNRLFLGGLENGLVMSYSKAFTPTEAVNFADEFSIKVDDEGGRITALEAMDDYLIIFKQDKIFVLTGNGPNNLGQSNDYQPPVKLSSDVGCSDPSSVVLTPIGVMFKSLKGIYLINRQLQVSYVGADVERYNSQTIVSSDVISKTNTIIFLTSSGVTLAYDYFVGQWSWYTNHEGYDACVWKNTYCYLRTDGTVYKRNESKYLDGLTQYSLKIVSAWVKLNGIQNFQRIKRALVLGDYYSAHVLKMSVAYDYNNYYFNEYNFIVDNVLQTNVYGEGATYGSDAVYGSVSDNVYQFDAHLKIQKCQSIKFKFEDVFLGTAGQAYSLSDLALVVAVKSGLNKLKSSKKVGG